MNENKDKQIRTVYRLSNDVVMVFDAQGEQIPEYQGQYREVREHILRDAPADAIFGYLLLPGAELRRVTREEW